MVGALRVAVIANALAFCIQVGGYASRTFPQSEARRPHPQRLAQEPWTHKADGEDGALNVGRRV